MLIIEAVHCSLALHSRTAEKVFFCFKFLPAPNKLEQFGNKKLLLLFKSCSPNRTYSRWRLKSDLCYVSALHKMSELGGAKSNGEHSTDRTQAEGSTNSKMDKIFRKATILGSRAH